MSNQIYAPSGTHQTSRDSIPDFLDRHQQSLRSQQSGVDQEDQNQSFRRALMKASERSAEQRTASRRTDSRRANKQLAERQSAERQSAERQSARADRRDTARQDQVRRDQASRDQFNRDQFSRDDVEVRTRDQLERPSDRTPRRSDPAGGDRNRISSSQDKPGRIGAASGRAGDPEESSVLPTGSDKQVDSTALEDGQQPSDHATVAEQMAQTIQTDQSGLEQTGMSVVEGEILGSLTAPEMILEEDLGLHLDQDSSISSSEATALDEVEGLQTLGVHDGPAGRVATDHRLRGVRADIVADTAANTDPAILASLKGGANGVTGVVSPTGGPLEAGVLADKPAEATPVASRPVGSSQLASSIDGVVTVDGLLSVSTGNDTLGDGLHPDDQGAPPSGGPGAATESHAQGDSAQGDSAQGDSTQNELVDDLGSGGRQASGPAGTQPTAPSTSGTDQVLAANQGSAGSVVILGDATGSQSQSPQPLTSAPIDAAAVSSLSNPETVEATVDPGVKDNPVWRQVQRAIGAIRTGGGGDHEFKIRLTPKELGSIMIDIRSSEAGVAIGLVTETAAASDRLNEQRDQLMEELAKSGLDSSAVDISHGNSDSGSDSDGLSTSAVGDSGNGGSAGLADEPSRPVQLFGVNRSTDSGRLDMAL